MEKLLMVDHTFLYTGAVQKMKQLITEGTVGNIKYLDSTRINLGLFQPDINVLWDLAPHDISILNYLINDIPYSVNATGVSHTNNNIENIAYLTVNYKSGFIAHFNCSWTSPVKIRMMLFGGDKKMMVFNDLEPTEKIRLYDTGYEHKSDEEKRKIMVDYRAGDVFIPKVDSKEALFGMASDFINSIKNNTTPISDFESGLSVIKILEASQQSIKQNGKEIILN
jgi:predicted dehydrogenase